MEFDGVMALRLGHCEHYRQCLTSADFDSLRLFDGVVDAEDGWVQRIVGRGVRNAYRDGYLFVWLCLGWADG